jgi:hypothetical protein
MKLKKNLKNLRTEVKKKFGFSLLISIIKIQSCLVYVNEVIKGFNIVIELSNRGIL